MRNSPKKMTDMYTKFTYWMDKQAFLFLQNKFSDMGISLHETRKAACLPLSGKIAIGYVPPEAWSNFELCKRQLSWYGTSQFAGKYLLVSETDISEYGFNFKPSTIISKVKFKPMDLPGSDNEKIKALVDRKSFSLSCPSAFKDIESMDTWKQSRWLRIMGIGGVAFKELFALQCANHANFIEPDYFINSEEGPVPYSIGTTKQVCSACLEFFSIIGANFRKKLVVPCPGAVLYAGMSVNTYYEVKTISPESIIKTGFRFSPE